MKLFYEKNYETMSKVVATQMFDLIQDKKDACICLATGNSPCLAYAYFVEMVNEVKLDISEVTFVKLDEWYKVDNAEPFTCEVFIKEHLLDKLHQPIKQYIGFDSNADSVEENIALVEGQLNEVRIDMMLLGLGMNGHLGLNEPHEYLKYDSHYSVLDEKTRTHDMVRGTAVSGGISLGLKAIFESKQVVMIVCGKRKEDSFKAFMSQKITTSTPASLLWLHHNCNTFVDESAFPK